MHYIKIEFSEKELNEIMEEIDQAQKKIFESRKRLESMGIAVVRESDHSDEQPTRATKKEMDDIDKTISNICKWIDGIMERTSHTVDPTLVPKTTEALAELTSVRAALIASEKNAPIDSSGIRESELSSSAVPDETSHITECDTYEWRKCGDILALSNAIEVLERAKGTIL